MKKTLLLFIITIFLSPLYSEETLILGEEDAWMGGNFYNLILNKGQRGFLDILVAHDQKELSSESDMLLPFDTGSPTDLTGHYRMNQEGKIQQDFARRGRGAAVFSRDGAIELTPEPGALFYPGEEWGDFTLQFWLYPSNLREGEILLEWDGFIQGQQRMLSQELSCRISKRSVIWEFQNFFLPIDRSESSFQLSGEKLIPRRWSHHMLRYHEETGLLEYLVDGVPSAIIHTTPSQHEETEIYHPKIEQLQATPLILGKDFTGFLDEVSLVRSLEETPSLLSYRKPGYYISPIQDLGYQDSPILEMDFQGQARGNSRIEYYYFLTNHIDDARKQLQLLQNRERPENFLEAWTSCQTGPLGAGIRGRYLILAALLYPDVGEEITPVFSSVKISYEEHLPPIPPLNLRARVVNGGIELNWDFSENSNIAGFLIYYGDRPGRYFGSSSPIRVSGALNQYLLTGLEAHKTWYISMVAYNDSLPAQHSDFSREVAIRP